MLENAAESHTSGARGVGQPADLPELLLKQDTTANTAKFYNGLDFWQVANNFDLLKRLLKMDFAKLI